MLVAGAAIGASGVLAAGAQAATYTVTGTTDNVGSCVALTCPTLRAALTAANADTTPDTITFQSGLTGAITVTAPLPISGTGGVTIDGPGAPALTVSGGGAHQVFDVTAPSSAAVSISGLTITDGNAGAGADGGAVEDLPATGAGAPLTLSNDTITNSTSADTTGGGGIYAKAAVTISGSTISGNSDTVGSGGGVAAATDSMLGGPQYNVAITNTTITGNTALDGGGVSGGNNVSISDSQITNNHARSLSTADGNGGAIASTTGLAAGTSLTLTGSTVSGNTSTNSGGGIASETKYGTTISDSTISGNTAVNGGGLELFGLSGLPGFSAKYNSVDVTDSTISGNSATNGSGIEIYGALPGSPIKIEASTISGNHGGANSFGGGLLINFDVYSPIDVIDSTISGNSATNGGGVSLSDGGTVPLLGHAGKGSISFDNSTIAGNAATATGGGIYLGEYTTGSPATKKSGTAHITSTIVAGNTAAGAPQDLARAATSTSGGFDGAFSLVQQPGNAPFLTSQSMLLGVNPQLGGLANNGGLTLTMLPSGTSPVIDQGHAPPTLTTDQRGDPRVLDVSGIPNPPGGDGADIGAVELPASSVIVPPPPTLPTPPSAGFSASIRGTLLGGPTTPLLVGNSTPVTCAVKVGTLASCVIEVRSTRGTLLANGEVTATSAATTLATKVTLTVAGLGALAHQPLGQTTAAHVFGSTSQSGSQTVTGHVNLLAVPSITLPIGKRSPKLAKGLLGQLDHVAKLLAGAKSITCTAYSDKGKGDVSLTSSQAKAACTTLVNDGFKGKVKSVGKGHSNPVASNRSGRGRTENRRLVITFSF